MAIIGKAAPRSDDIIEKVAANVGCEPAVIDAILQTETNADAFDPSRRLIIRPEFHKIATCPYIDPAHKKAALKIPQPKLPAYERDPVHAGSVAWQYVDRLAAECGEEAAFWITSFGSPQIMGFNAPMCGYDSPSAMVRDFADSEDAQLFAMGKFIVAAGLKEACRLRKWKAIARSYNGKDYAKNAYDSKLAFAYEHSGRARDTASFHYPDDEFLEFGERGNDVRALQERLRELGFHVDPDGDFGAETRDAVRAAQFRLGLPVDGKVSLDTRKALAAAPAKEPNTKPIGAIIKDSGTAQAGIAMAATGLASTVVATANSVVPTVPAMVPVTNLTDIDAVIKTSETGIGLASKILAIGVDKLLIAIGLGGIIFGLITLYKRIQAQRLRKVG